jgi:hypothetical protein
MILITKIALKKYIFRCLNNLITIALKIFDDVGRICRMRIWIRTTELRNTEQNTSGI